MQKIVKESIHSILRPKTQKEVTDEIKRRLAGKDLTTIKETPDYIIYQVKKSSDIQDIVKNMGGRDEEVFFNFYLILDNGVTGFRQIIGIKVAPDGTITAFDPKGSKIEAEYLNKFE